MNFSKLNYQGKMLVFQTNGGKLYMFLRFSDIITILPLTINDCGQV